MYRATQVIREMERIGCWPDQSTYDAALAVVLRAAGLCVCVCVCVCLSVYDAARAVVLRSACPSCRLNAALIAPA